MSERSERMKVASDALLDCPDCGGQGWVEGIGMAHHPSCDGSCRNCPVPVQTQEPCDTCGGSGQVKANAEHHPRAVASRGTPRTLDPVVGNLDSEVTQ